MMVLDRRHTSLGNMNDSQLDAKQQRLLQEVMKLSSSNSNTFVPRDYDFTVPATPPPSTYSTPSLKKTKDSKNGSTVKDGAQCTTPVTESKKKSNKPNRTKGVSPPTIKNVSSNTSLDAHFSGSAYENSPDASQLPLPDFDEELPEFFSEHNGFKEESSGKFSLPSYDKSDTLKRFLKLRAP